MELDRNKKERSIHSSNSVSVSPKQTQKDICSAFPATERSRITESLIK